jgi:hypothetical protein
VGQEAEAMSRKRSTRRSPLKGFRIPTNLVAWGAVLFSLFVLSGGIYNLLESPLPFIPYGNRYLTLHPYFSDQTVYESVFVFLSNIAVFMGLWLSYRSTQVAYDRTKANRYLLLGIGLTLAGISGNYLLIEMKKTILG